MNIFYREIKSNFKALCFWCGGMAILLVAGIGKFEGIGGQSLNKIMSKMPPFLKAVFGLGGLDLSTMSGYFGLLFLYVALLAAVHAASIGAGIISKEERDRTFEFLYVRPITRAKIAIEKFAAAVVNIIILNIVTLIVSIGIATKMSKDNITSELVMLMTALFIVQLIFLTISMAISVTIKNSKSASGIASSIVMGTYLLYVVVDLNENLDFLKYLTPFKYFDATNLLKTGIDGVYIILSGIIIIISILATLFFHQRKDLKV